MDILQRCTAVWGTDHINEGDPGTTVLRGGFYLPYMHGSAWGILDEDGRIEPSTVDYREGVHPPGDQDLNSSLQIVGAVDFAPDPIYIYGGRINRHFGHFIINTLSRFWSMSKVRSPGTKILCHGDGTPEQWFAIPFIGSCFRALGLSPSDFVVFKRKTRLRYLIIPHTSIEEQKSGYKCFRVLCREIGKVCGSGLNDRSDARKIYYSKTRLSYAISGILNEIEIEEFLRSKGVLIIYPEEMTFEDQIRIMNYSGSILCTTGSFLHASIFCEPRRISCINLIHDIHANYSIIDRLVGNNANYYWPPSIKVLEDSKSFQTGRLLPNAKDVAERLLDLAQTS